MLGIGRQGNAQVLVVNDTGANYYLWQNGGLELVLELGQHEEDQAALSFEFSAHRKLPLLIVADLIEESFRNESVVHVRGPDRSALLQRRLGNTFRKTPYRAARVVGREPAGRRNDRIMMSALTRPDQLQSWIDLALEYEMAIQCITSLPYLSESYAGASKLNRVNNLLLVSLENNFRLRQTYLNDGKMLFSRCTTLTSSDAATLVREIQQETNQIRSYLERIRLLDFDSPLTVQINTLFEYEDLPVSLDSADRAELDFNTIRDTGTHQSRDSTHAIEGHFLSRVFSTGAIRNVYATTSIGRFQLLRKSNRWLWAASFSLLFLTLLYKAPVAFSIYDKRQQEMTNRELTEPYEFQYEVLRRRFPETPIPSNEMALIVETLETVTAQSPDPDFLVDMLMAALTRSPELQLTNIEFMQEEVRGGSSVSRSRRISDTGIAFERAVIEERTRLRMVVEGLAFSTSSYRAAQDQVLDFAYALDAVPGMDVTPVKMPTDVRLDVSMRTTVGIDDLQAPFALEVVMEPEP